MKKFLIIALTFLFLTGGAFKFFNNKSSIKGSNLQITDEIKKAEAQITNETEPEYKAVAPVKPKVKYYSNRVVVLTYHHISNEPFSGITIKTDRFEKDLKMLKENDFNVISMRQLLDSMDGKYKLPDNAVVISFDDGIESYYKYAYPVLLKYRMPSVNYIITYRNEHYRPSNKDFNPLSADEIREMYKSGLVDIQSHTHNSHDLVYINSDLKMAGKLAHRIYDKKSKKYESKEEYLKRIKMDLNTSRNIIYRYTGSYPDMLCFPFGHYNDTLIKAAKECGFNYFITTQYGVNKKDSHSNKVLRIRAGDSKLTSEKLMENIIQCGNKKAKNKK